MPSKIELETDRPNSLTYMSQKAEIERSECTSDTLCKLYLSLINSADLMGCIVFEWTK